MIPSTASSPPQRPQEFVDEVLVERARATHVSVGENFRFGHKAKGDPALLAGDDRFETRVVAAAGGRRRGRQLQPHPRPDPGRRGRVRRPAARRAVRHVRRGRPRRQARPRRWASRRRTSSRPRATSSPATASTPACAARRATLAAVNVGVRPKFVTGRGELIEAYLIDFEGDLYGTASRASSSSSACAASGASPGVDELIAQMGRDVETTRAIAGGLRRYAAATAAPP